MPLTTEVTPLHLRLSAVAQSPCSTTLQRHWDAEEAVFSKSMCGEAQQLRFLDLIFECGNSEMRRLGQFRQWLGGIRIARQHSMNLHGKGYGAECLHVSDRAAVAYLGSVLK